jgi:hypothetical protein
MGLGQKISLLGGMGPLIAMVATVQGKDGSHNHRCGHSFKLFLITEALVARPVGNHLFGGAEAPPKFDILYC